jgi:hypothetical protein
MQTKLIALMKAGQHTLSFLNHTKPCGAEDFPSNFGASFLNASQRQAWSEHTAWTAVDYVKSGVDVALEYSVLAKLCGEMLNANCVGVYIPREQRFYPNDGSLRGELQRMAGFRRLP